MRTFAESNRSKKSIKKEQKKMALLEAGGDNSGSADDKAAAEASAPGSESISAREKLQLKFKNS